MDGTNLDKRSQIIRAAARVFAAKGFHLAKVEEIASDAGVGKGTVYEYFSSKKELFQEMFKSSSMFYLETFRLKLAGEKTIAEKLSQIVTLHLQFIDQHKDIGKILLREHSEIGEGLHQWMMARQEEKVSFVKGMFDEGVQTGELRPMDTEIAARTFFGSVAAVGGYMMCQEKDDFDLDHISEQTTDLFIKGIENG